MIPLPDFTLDEIALIEYHKSILFSRVKLFVNIKFSDFSFNSVITVVKEIAYNLTSYTGLSCDELLTVGAWLCAIYDSVPEIINEVDQFMSTIFVYLANRMSETEYFDNIVAYLYNTSELLLQILGNTEQ
jgi:hypothetical protein